MRTRALLLSLCLCASVAKLFGPVFFDVRDYGAKGDGAAKDTAGIQAAIDAAAKQGGGVVMLPAGNYLSGTIHLKSRIAIHLAPGAILTFSPDQNDFDPYEKLDYKSFADNETTYFHYALLAGENVENIAIEGQGTIDGNRSKRGGPKPIALKNCRHVTIRGITIKNAPNYAISFLGVDYADVDGVTILNGYADGIDPDSSRHVRISNCSIDSWDDAICPKASLALGKPRSTEHITVTNCSLSSSSNNFKIGTESSGDFKNIALSNCVMFRRAQNASRDRSGIAIESVDGSHIDGVVISNVTMQDVYNPIFIRLGNRGRGLNPPTPGALENVSISNVVATGATMTTSITGLPSHPVRRINLDNIQITMKGGEQNARGLEVPENPAKYPESTMFGVLPAYGLYCRHAEGLTLRNVQPRWEQQDQRPALIFDDVKDLDLNGFKTDTVTGSHPIIWLNQVSGAFLHGCRIAARAERFLRISGDQSREIRLVGNDLGRVRDAVDLGTEVPKGALSSASP